MAPRLRIDPAVTARFPAHRCAVLYASGLAAGPSDAASIQALRDAEVTARVALAGTRPADHPHIAAWRAVTAATGLKPARFPCSAEALLTRVLKGQELPSINRIVDHYNAISLRHVLPMGGEDWDQLDGELVLRFATGDEPFEGMADGQPVTVHPEPGEVVWADALGVTCRAWNWRQCRRTRLTEATRNAYFVLEALPPLGEAELTAAAGELDRFLTAASPACRIELVWL